MKINRGGWREGAGVAKLLNRSQQIEIATARVFQRF